MFEVDHLAQAFVQWQSLVITFVNFEFHEGENVKFNSLRCLK